MWFPCNALNHWHGVHIKTTSGKMYRAQHPLYVAFIDLTKASTLLVGLVYSRSSGALAALTHCLTLYWSSTMTCMLLLRSMAWILAVFRSIAVSSRGAFLLPPSEMFFTALLIRAFSKPSGVLLHCRTSGNCLIFPIFMPSRKSDDYLSENCCMQTMLPLWQPPFKTSAAPSLVSVLNFILLSAWAKTWSYLRDLALPRTSILTELCCNQLTSSVTWGQHSTTRTLWNPSLTFA